MPCWLCRSHPLLARSFFLLSGSLLSSRLRWKSKTQIQCCEATADAKSLHGRPGCVQELLRDEELLLVFKQVGVCYPRIILYVFVVVVVLKSVPAYSSLCRVVLTFLPTPSPLPFLQCHPPALWHFCFTSNLHLLGAVPDRKRVLCMQSAHGEPRLVP